MNSASIRPAQTQDLPQMYNLLACGSRSFANVGEGDLPGLLQERFGAAVQVDSQSISGFVVLHKEVLADELSARAPVRVSLRAAATKYPGAKARRQFSALFECAEETLPAWTAGQLFYAMTDQGWLKASLTEAGFKHRDSIRFYERVGPVAQPQHQPADLRPAARSDLPHLARLDEAAFEPLWHMGVAELGRLYSDCRLEVAVRDGQTAGYAALNLHTDGGRRDEGAAQLVRLAVHPQAQDRGIGRQLLVSSLLHAHAQGICRVLLNTQESNRPSQRLYESMQFRKRGRAVPVYVKSKSIRRN